jgi:hypothetical protein
VILPIHEVFYIEMLTYHTTAIVEQTNRINFELNAMTSSNDARESQEKANALLNALQEALGHTAAISRYFWPVRKGALHEERGRQLRTVYGVDDTSPLHNRDVRNAIEHFDERLDVFMESFPTGTIYPSYIGSRAKAEAGSIHCFRAYFVDNQVFRILDTEIHMPQILNEIGRIQELLGKQIAVGSRFTSSPP